MPLGDADPTLAPFWELMRDFWRPRAAAAAVQLGIPDVIGDGPMTSAEIAKRIDADPLAVLRLMRALASMGVCIDRGESEFELTPAGRMLRSGQPQGHAFHLGNVLWSMFADFHTLVRNGGRAIKDDAAGFENLSMDPAALVAFHSSMAAQAMAAAEDLTKVYDFSQYRTVMDVGGGYGGLLRGLLERYPAMTGTVFDIPIMADDTRRYLADAGLSDRADFIGGDFFVEVPAGRDAYLLKYILHDWDDEKAIQILSSCRKAAGANGAVLLVEHVIPERVEDSAADRFVVGMDLIMMGYGGRERTLREYSALFEAAGLTLTQAAPGPTSGFSLLEGIPAKIGPERAAAPVPADEREVEAAKERGAAAIDRENA